MKNFFSLLSETSSCLLFQNNAPKEEPSFWESLQEKFNSLSKDVVDGIKKGYESASKLSDSTWESMKSGYKKTEGVSNESWEKIKNFYNEALVPFYENSKMKSGDAMRSVEMFFSENGKNLSAESKKDIESLLNETKSLKEKAKNIAKDAANWAEKAKTNSSDFTKEQYQSSLDNLKNLGDSIRAKEEQLVGKLVLSFAKGENKNEK